MRHGSLFSGIGGFDLAAEWMGWENVFQIEKDSFCQNVLEKNFPNTKRYGDIKEFNGTKYRGAVDIISGGFPCQPFSSAGKRKGTDDHRHFWPEMLRVIREVQPAYVVGENVYGILNWSKGLVFEQVCADLENGGYQVQPVILPACSVDAPHRRDRVWFVAYSACNDDRRAKRELCEEDGRPVGELLSASSGTGNGFCKEGPAANPNQFNGNLSGFRAGKVPFKQTSGIQQDIITNTYSHDAGRCGYGEVGQKEITSEGQQKERQRIRPIFKRISEERIASNANNVGLQRRENKTERQITINRNTWNQFPTQPPLRDGDDGLSAGLVRSAIQAGGNSIVPQVAYKIFKAIEQNQSK